MQVQTINNNQTSFRAIYQSTEVEFTPKQNEVISNIIETLRKPSIRYGNKNAENYYKAKKNIDFSIENYNRCEDSVYVKGLYNKTENNDNIIYERPFGVGVYSPDNKFKLSDINKGIQGDKGPSLYKMILAPTIALAAILGLRACNKIPGETKPIIENTEKYINNLDSLEAKSIVNTKLWRI